MKLINKYIKTLYKVFIFLVILARYGLYVSKYIHFNLYEMLYILTRTSYLNLICHQRLFKTKNSVDSRAVRIGSFH